MSTPSTLIAQARLKTGVDSTNYTDAQGIVDFNFVYQDLIADIITEIDEDYFWNIVKATTVAGQEEYTINVVGSVKLNQVNKLFVKYSSNDTYYVQARKVNPNALDKDMDWYKDHQSKLDPIFMVQDNSVFLYPAPTEAIANGLKMNCIFQPADLTISSVEADIALPVRFHRYIMEGIIPFIYSYRGKMAESVSAMQVFDKKKREMISQMKNRNQSIIQVTSPDLNQYT